MQNEDNEITVDPKLVEAFHLMFDCYPEAAQLTHKSKKIVALNPACEAFGRQVGMICIKHGSPESHKGCLANKAIKEQIYKRNLHLAEIPAKREYSVFWLPVPGHPDFYIHFSAGHPSYYPDAVPVD